MKILFSMLLIICAIMGVRAQDLQHKIKTLTLGDSVIHVAIDRPGDFYVVTTTGQIQRYDKDGKLTLSYQAERIPTAFDPRDGARLFVYYRDDQHYEYLSPSFQPLTVSSIDPAFAIRPWLICPSGEYKLWILDNADESLKRINVKESEVEVEITVDSTLLGKATSVESMREYQNFVFLLNPEKGIHIFNSLGRLIKTIDIAGIGRFNFLGEELYYLTKGKLEFFNLFSAETRHLDIDPKYTDVLLTDERMILFTPGRIDIFPFRP
ncbi:MAG TPA: hypothetical protein VFO54_02690 [Chryseosolibacter sp.]|nr:hypothetical protein [Chryseosolibacter sp.]